MSEQVHTHSVTVTFADTFKPRTKVRKCTLAEGQSAMDWAKGHFVRTVKSAKAVPLTTPAPAPKPVQEAKPAPASKPPMTKAELRARVAELELLIATPAPARKPRVTQTRDERKASTARKATSDAESYTTKLHRQALEFPAYVAAYERYSKTEMPEGLKRGKALREWEQDHARQANKARRAVAKAA